MLDTINVGAQSIEEYIPVVGEDKIAELKVHCS